MNRFWVLVLPLLVGCGEIDHRDYVASRASAECAKYRTCAQGYYESEFRDHDDCLDDVGDALNDLEDTVYDGCDYDGVEARACVSRIRGMSCEDFAEGDAGSACDLVWDCRN